MATTIRQLGLRLGMDPREVRGAAKVLGVHFERVGPSDRISDEDAEKISEALKPYHAVTTAAS